MAVTENYLKISEKTVVVIGCNSSVGRAIALHAAEQGAHVALVDSDFGKAEKLADTIMDQREIRESHGRARAIAFDPAKPENWKDIVANAAQAFGCVDLIVDASLFSKKSLSGESTNMDLLSKHLDLNLRLPVIVAEEALKYLKPRRHSKILFLVPEVFHLGLPGDSYAALSRTGLIAFAKTLGKEVAGTSTSVNCLSIGPTEEYLLERHGGPVKEALDKLGKEGAPLKFADPTEIAELVCFLISPRSNALNSRLI